MDIEERIKFNKRLLTTATPSCRVIEMTRLLRKSKGQSQKVKDIVRSLMIEGHYYYSCNCGNRRCFDRVSGSNCCFWTDLNCSGLVAWLSPSNYSAQNTYRGRGDRRGVG
jgi:hypothetical protein